MPFPAALANVAAFLAEKTLITTGVLMVGGATTAAAFTGALPMNEEPAETVVVEEVVVPEIPEEPVEPIVKTAEESLEEAVEEPVQEANDHGLPEGMVCNEEQNHGQNVSRIARGEHDGNHGEMVSAMAQSDCGKPDHDEIDESTEASEEEDHDQDERLDQDDENEDRDEDGDEDEGGDEDEDGDKDDDDNGRRGPKSEKSNNGRGNGRG